MNRNPSPASDEPILVTLKVILSLAANVVTERTPAVAVVEEIANVGFVE